MKIDKETLIKHRFWIALGAQVLLFLIALAVLFFSASKTAAKAKREFDQDRKVLDAPQDPKNAGFLPPWDKRKKFYQDYKFRIWDAAWETQKDLMTWPADARRMEPKRQLENGYYGDPIPEDYRLAYHTDLYKTQFADRMAFLAPRGGERPYLPVDFDEKKIFAPNDRKKPPTVEECWLAQEEIWVRRELL